MVQKERSLKGRTIVVTRPRNLADETVDAILQLGGKPYLFPTIEIRPSKDLGVVKQFFKALARKEVDYVVFMSVNGVQHLLAIANNLEMEDEVKTGLKTSCIVAVGPRTAQELERNSIEVDLIPEKYTSDGILKCLQQRSVKDKVIYIPRTSEAPPELGEKLREMGSHVEDVYVYSSELPSDKEMVLQFARNLEAGKLDAILFTSSLGVKNFIQLLKSVLSAEKLATLVAGMAVVAIGPTTAKTLTEASIQINVMPQKHTLDGALNALSSYWNTEKC